MLKPDDTDIRLKYMRVCLQWAWPRTQLAYWRTTRRLAIFRLVR
jgi:hypothetical protein